MVFVPNHYRGPQGGASLMRDDADAAAEEVRAREALARAQAEVDDIVAQRRLFARYMVELGITPPKVHGPATSDVVRVDVDLIATANYDRSLFSGVGISPPFTRPPKTWREFIAVVLRGAGRSLSHQEVIEVGKDTEFWDRFKAGPNGYYNTVRMMELNGELVKIGKRLYDPALYARIQSGEIQEDLPVEATRQSVPNIIVRVLREHGSGLTAAGIINAFAGIPEAHAIATKNPALIRTHLTKMKQAAKLVSDNGQYKLPEWSRDAEVVLPFPGGSRGQ